MTIFSLYPSKAEGANIKTIETAAKSVYANKNMIFQYFYSFIQTQHS